MPIVEVTSLEEVQTEMDKSYSLAVIMAYTPWCTPCEYIEPYVVQQADELGVCLLKFNPETCPKMGKKYHIQSLPTFLVVKGKSRKSIKHLVGASESNVNIVMNMAVDHRT